MKRFGAIALSVCLAGPASADVDAALDRHILPGLDAFADAAAKLERETAEDCRAEALRPAWNAAFDAWTQIGDLRIGPSETGALSIAFWPDARGFTPRTLSRLVAESDPIVFDPAAYSDVSIAARGLYALEMLIHDPAFADYGRDSYGCALARAISSDLAGQAARLEQAWEEAFAETLRTAGAPDNAIYLDEDEAFRALYTQILSSLDFTAEQRLGRPMGEFDRPRPTRAEAWRSGRSLRNAVLAVDAAHALAKVLADWPLPETDAAVARVHEAAAHIDDPSFQDLTNPQGRLRAEVLQQAVRGVRASLETETGARLGITPGFNSRDGD
ncbi:putative periplasmic lipoprotein [Jannaschia seosinensis]|uniref:Putative periplasmic lipoprotein n=1 Tax=Jannaschia seosinensis TaxID=313367 RepID=A0A0M7BCB0_9RHOB|nr:imelysin family protein [Jannaschia seosinensis]CUH40021.1 putative periplasmic lipoprotein [Jannaschia seosinensis]